MIILLYSINLNAQKISGFVKSTNGQAIPYANIKIKELNIGAIADTNGKFTIKSNVSDGEYTFIVSSLGYITLEEKKNVSISTHLSFTLKEDVNNLQEVEVVGESDAQRLEQAGYQVDRISTEDLMNKSTDINQILKTTAGINVRESGGLGSGFNLSLNGLTGNQVRYYIDGVPMESYGSSLTLNNYPVNLIEDIEVYKGVVPIDYGADALGGIINIKTAGVHKTFLDASYSVGSFNTHRVSVNGQYSNQEKGYFVSFSSFFNHSDNDYTMKGVPLYDELGNFVGNVDAKRFNDQYTSGMGTLKFGVFNKKYADELSIGVTYAENKDHKQHPDNTTNVVFGHLHTRNKTALTTLNYKKSFGKFNVKAYVNAGLIEDVVIDTVGAIYRWDGSHIDRDPATGRGEFYDQKTMLTITDKVVRSNVNVGYELNDNHSFMFNASQSFLERTGNDPINENNKTFKSPNQINKATIGVAWLAKTNNEKFEFSAFRKQYFYSGHIVSQDYNGSDIVTDANNGGTGFGATITYNVTDDFRIKTSYEKAFRMPESYELLGDGMFVHPNPVLQPEKSHNVNLSLSYTKSNAIWDHKAETNLFYRNSQDFIRFLPKGPTGQYENLANVRSTGIEAGYYVEYLKKINLSTNVTYQNITDQTAFDEGLANVNYQSRVPNIPYFFGNLRVGYNVFQKPSKKLAVYWNTRYVHQFFLNWENSGNPDDKLIIPSQLTHDLDIEYGFKEGKYNLAFTVSNITDEVVYDNYKIQKPGRAFYLKFRYYFNK